MKTGVYVGSFDPPHLGHIGIVNYLLNSKIIDQIIIIPTKNYWNKQNLTEINHRTNMLKIFENEQIIIDQELGRFTYTYEILEDLKRKKPKEDFYLVIGADNLEKFHLWEKVDTILNHKILVLNRNNIDVKKYIEEFDSKETFQMVSGFPSVAISSSEIREKINNKKNASKLLDSRVEKYMKENNLYGG